MPADSVPKTILVAGLLCLFASMVVSAAAVSLRPVQQANALRDKQINVLQVAGVYEPGLDVTEAFAAFEPHVLELASGEFTDRFDGGYDDKAALGDPELSRAL
ncbi:MAG: Na(+)-translocating NADH-quinone reductase subunit C, partial [Mangrovicoccus sp.]